MEKQNSKVIGPNQKYTLPSFYLGVWQYFWFIFINLGSYRGTFFFLHLESTESGSRIFGVLSHVCFINIYDFKKVDGLFSAFGYFEINLGPFPKGFMSLSRLLRKAG